MADHGASEMLPWEGSGGVGICLSGGGIRAAAFALGALQGLQDQRGLLFGSQSADHLAVVSGGSYTGAAFVLNAAALADGEGSELPPLAQGSPEAEHIVSSGGYLLHGGLLRASARWISADVLNFCAFLALAIWAGTLLATYAWVAHAYLGVPILDNGWRWPVAAFAIAGGALILRGIYKDGGVARTVVPLVGLAILTGAAPTFVGVVQKYQATSRADWWWQWRHVWPVLVVIAAVTIGWVLVRHRTEAHAVSEVSVMIPRAAGFVLLALATSDAFESFTRGMAVSASVGEAESSTVRYFGVLIAGLVFSWVAARVSLHRFYRDQLSWCFSIRREGPQAVRQVTSARLSDLGPPPRGSSRRFPRLLISATANVVVRGPDGRRRGFAPFVMSHDCCGIPGVAGASFDTHTIESIAAPAGVTGGTEPLLSLMSGVASTGAAVSPSMGAHTVRAARSFIAVLNIRLGRWFPNPLSPRIRRELREAEANQKVIKWTSWHRGMGAGYDEFLPELFGLHQPDAPRLYVSDGGHFDNLGLLALLRAGCTEIWCVDSQADKNGRATQLLNVFNLARTELGVTVTLDTDVFAGGDGILGASHALGRFEYRDGTTGRIVVIKLGLTDGSPRELKERRRTDRLFPHHPTFPFQMFAPDRMDAYRRLGFTNACEAASAAQSATDMFSAPY